MELTLNVVADVVMDEQTLDAAIAQMNGTPDEMDALADMLSRKIRAAAHEKRLQAIEAMYR